MPIGEEAERLLCRSDSELASLLDQRYFFSAVNMHRCYALAGGFTGFLIRRFGWDAYREYYRRADQWTFRARFQKQFGISLEEGFGKYWRDRSLAIKTLLRRRLRNKAGFSIRFATRRVAKRGKRSEANPNSRRHGRDLCSHRVAIASSIQAHEDRSIPSWHAALRHLKSILDCEGEASTTRPSSGFFKTSGCGSARAAARKIDTRGESVFARSLLR